MTGQELLNLFDKAHRRSHLTGTRENGIIAGLDLEGRLFAVKNDKVLNRVVPHAILNHSNKTLYLNPGGDALWPAPEGTCFGYEYGTGNWRVPPAITGAVWEVISHSSDHTVIRAEIDLVSNLQTGIPCEFERHITVSSDTNSLVQKVKEVIRYIGKKRLLNGEFLLAPWSLCQFDSGTGGKVIMPEPFPGDIWDLYTSSVSQRGMSDGIYVIETKTDSRFQLGLGKNVQWIEFIWGNDFRAKRYAGKIHPGQNHIDISDLPPDQSPSSKGVSLSVYCDPSGFMEIEACGGCPETLDPGTEMSVEIVTEYVSNTN
jgi:hypothetical protein